MEIGGQVAGWQHRLAAFIALQFQSLDSFAHLLESLVPQNLLILVNFLDVRNLWLFDFRRFGLLRSLGPFRAHFEGLWLDFLKLIVVDFK